MNIQPVRIFGKDDIDNYRNTHAPNNGMININPLITTSQPQIRNEKEEIKNDDEVSLPEFEETIDNDPIDSLSRCDPSSLREEGEEESSEEETQKKRSNVFGNPDEKKEKKPFSRSSLIYIAMGISLLKFL